MPEHTFETHRPVDLSVEIGKGRVVIDCADTTESRVEVTGTRAGEVVVEQDGDHIRVAEPRRGGGLFRDSALEVSITVPHASDLTVRTGSADLSVTGPAGSAHLRSGSGDVDVELIAGSVQVETGSGSIGIGETQGEGRIKSGSGDVVLGRVGAELSVSTGSGDVVATRVDGPLAVKTGSGDIRARESHSDLSATSGSGDLVIDRSDRGRINVKGASGDVRIGIGAGVPVWTDLLTISGEIRSEIESAGEPAPGQDHVEVRAKTVSGDITLSNS